MKTLFDFIPKKVQPTLAAIAVIILVLAMVTTTIQSQNNQKQTWWQKNKGKVFVVGAGLLEAATNSDWVAKRMDYQKNPVAKPLGNLGTNLAYDLGYMFEREQVARLSGNEVYINVEGGGQWRAYVDDQGNPWLDVGNGSPINISHLINMGKKDMAMGMPVEATLGAYNEYLLERNYSFIAEKKPIQYRYEYPVSLQDIAFQTKVQITDIYVALAGVKKEYDGTSEAASYLPYYSAAQIKSLGKKGWDFKKAWGKLWQDAGFARVPGMFLGSANKNVEIFVNKNVYESKLNSFFFFKWAKDFGGTGFDFNDFEGRRKSFYDTETFKICLRYQSEETNTHWKIYFTNSGGQTIYVMEGSQKDVKAVFITPLVEKYLPPGVYRVDIVIKNSKGETFLEKRGDLEIIKSLD